jgi:putative transposase
MSNYRRLRVPGGCYFFTVNVWERRDATLLTRHIAPLRAAVRRVRAERPFTIDAWVVLPDHLHAVWTLPAGDDDFSTRWRLIKTFFTRGLPRGERISRSRRAARERGIWQRRFWEHAIRDDADYAAHVDYVHFNPVKHGLAATPAAWPYSTFRTCVERGHYPPDWAGNGVRDIPAAEPSA